MLVTGASTAFQLKLPAKRRKVALDAGSLGAVGEDDRERETRVNILSCYPLPGILYTHDAAACIVSDDGVRFAGEEERYLRSQHGIGHFPERAVMMAFQQTGLQPHDITHLATVSMERCRRQADYQRRLRFARETASLPERVPALCVPHYLAHSVLSVLDVAVRQLCLSDA